MYKTHKQQAHPPLRPVVSQCDSPTEKLAQLCNNILNQAVSLIPTNITSTEMFMKRLQKKFSGKLTEKHILFSADITALYTNIPLKHCLDVTTAFIRNNAEEIDMMGLTMNEFETILEAIMNLGYFRFHELFFQQIKGLAMGSRPAPPLAILYVYLTVELPLLSLIHI